MFSFGTMIGLIFAAVIVSSANAAPKTCRVCGGLDPNTCIIARNVADEEGVYDVPVYPAAKDCPSKTSENVWDFLQKNIKHADVLSPYKEEELTSSRDTACFTIDKSRYVAVEKSKATAVCSTNNVVHWESSDFIVGCMPPGMKLCLMQYQQLLNITRGADGKNIFGNPDPTRDQVSAICKATTDDEEITTTLPQDLKGRGGKHCKKSGGDIVRGCSLFRILTAIIFFVRFA